jgi:hypothetical protein
MDGPGGKPVPAKQFMDYEHEVTSKHGNIDPNKPQDDGIYAVLDGTPIYKFKVLIVAGHVRKVGEEVSRAWRAVRSQGRYDRTDRFMD